MQIALAKIKDSRLVHSRLLQRKEGVSPPIYFSGVIRLVSNSIVKSINWHFTSLCNYKCRFCCTQKVHGEFRSLERANAVLTKLEELGIEKINYAGGEPLCNPLIYDLVKLSKEKNFVNSIITNGSLIDKKTLERISPYVDWIGLSIDSASDKIEAKLGRGQGNHVSHALKIAPIIQESGVKLKINTVVNKLNFHEDLGSLIDQLSPDRWKVLQMMHIDGQNDSCIDELLITDREYLEFCIRHKKIRLSNGQSPIFESQDMMLKSYLMLSPNATLFMNNKYPYKEYDLATATKELISKIMDINMYIARGAVYNWR